MLWQARPGLLAGSAALSSGASVSYAGPGDIVSGATGFWSSARAYSLATAGTNLMDLVDQAGANLVTIKTLGTGFVDLSAISAWVSANSVSTIKVAKLYNQANPGTADMVNSGSISTKPTLTLSALSGLPATTFSGSSGQFLAASSTITQATPFSMSAVVNRTTATSGGFLGADNVQVNLRGAGTANNMGFECGSAVGVSCTDNTFHALNASCPSTSGQGAIRIDGTDTTGQTVGTTGLSGSTLRLGLSNAGIYLYGMLPEAIFYPIAYTTQNRSDMNANHHGTSGYNF